jgi:DNA-3-methyladenine glycosylase
MKKKIEVIKHSNSNIISNLNKKRKHSEFSKQNSESSLSKITRVFKKSKNFSSSSLIIKKETRNFDYYSKMRIQREFFLINAVDLAEKLLGKIIVRKIGDNKIIRGRIVETEAYMGGEDKASHAYKNRKTDRTKAFWNPGGHLYVYLIYGINHCMNIVANDENTPQGALIRAIEPIEGIEIIKKNRGINIDNDNNGKKKSHQTNLTNGPGKVAAALKIDRSYNSVDLCSSEEILLMEDSDPDYKFEIKTSSRVNIDYAGDYKHKQWRFFIEENIYVSKVKLK